MKVLYAGKEYKCELIRVMDGYALFLSALNVTIPLQLEFQLRKAA